MPTPDQGRPLRQAFPGQVERQTPLEDLRLDGNVQLRFRALEDFNPQPSGPVPAPLPDSLETLLSVGDGDRPVTKEEARSMMHFLAAYLRSPLGKKVLASFGARTIEEMAPGVAVRFCVSMVASLAKYSHQEARDTDRRLLPTRADTLPADELLAESLSHYGEASWAGLGVCRNFARAVKVAFEAIRLVNPCLENVYCVYVAGNGHRRESRQRAKGGGVLTHAWNVFVSLTEPEETQLTIVDATWAKLDVERGALEKADHTGTRLAPVIEALSRRLRDPESYVSCLRYYDTIVTRHRPVLEAAQQEADQVCTQRGRDACLAARQKEEEERDFQDYYVWKAYTLWLRFHRQRVGTQLPSFPALRDAFPDYQRRFTKEVGIWTLTDVLPTDDDSLISLEAAVAILLERKAWSRLLRSWRTKPSVFVQAVLEGLRARPEFPALVRSESGLRLILREVQPDWLPPFDPYQHIEDVQEWKALLESSTYLRKHVLRYVRERYAGTSLRHLRAQDVGPIDRLAREVLRSIDPHGAEEGMAALDARSLIDGYDEMYERLKAGRISQVHDGGRPHS